MRKPIWKPWLLVLLLASPVAAQTKPRYVWIAKPHPAKACAEAADDRIDTEAIALDKVGVLVQDSVLGIDRARRAAKPDCGRVGFYMIAHQIAESDVVAAEKLGYRVAPETFSKSSPEF